jgi:phospholipid N-methyltransferase
MLGADEQAATVRAMLALRPRDGRFLAYSYRLGSPLRAARLGLTAERLDFTLRNALPASVWAFRAAGTARQPDA